MKIHGFLECTECGFKIVNKSILRVPLPNANAIEAQSGLSDAWSYLYEPLRLSQTLQEIRLIIPEPGSANKDIAGTITHKSLHELDFEALSYS